MIKTLKKVYSYGGMKMVIFVILRKIFPVPNTFLYWDSFVLWKVTPSITVPHVKDKSNRHYFGLATIDDIHAIKDQYPEWEDATKERMNDVDNPACVIVKENSTGDVLGFGWIKLLNQSKTDSGYVAHLEGDNPAWGYGYFIRKDYRGTDVLMKLVKATEKYCRGKNCSGIFAETLSYNYPALKAFKKLGMNIFQDVVFFSVLGWKIYIIKDYENRCKRVILGSRSEKLAFSLNST